MNETFLGRAGKRRQGNDYRATLANGASVMELLPKCMAQKSERSQCGSHEEWAKGRGLISPAHFNEMTYRRILCDGSWKEDYVV